MKIIPAIDLIDGTAVRLTQGDYGTAEKVADDPVEAAKRFASLGAKWLHIVDLDGAKEGTPVNAEVIGRIIAATRATGMRVEVGGGIRTIQTIKEYLNMGVGRTILGSVAIHEPDLVREAISRFGWPVTVGIDAREGRVQAGGWLEDSEVSYLDLAAKMDEAGVHTIIYTDIARDGTLAGPNLEELKAINERVQTNVIASGGIRDINDVKSLIKLDLYGAIVGKSIYQGTLDLEEAIATTAE
jgi:phosphoribosylformimino-5-aminoimidazole carboxamide ribotide isomerase